MDSTFLKTKKAELFAILKRFDSLLVAFSGGIDSTLLLAAAREVLKDRVTCVTAISAVCSKREVDNAAALAKHLGVNHIISHPGIMDDGEFLKNTRDRCRICKQIIFSDFQSFFIKFFCLSNIICNSSKKFSWCFYNFAIFVFF